MSGYCLSKGQVIFSARPDYQNKFYKSKPVEVEKYEKLKIFRNALRFHYKVGNLMGKNKLKKLGIYLKI